MKKGYKNMQESSLMNILSGTYLVTMPGHITVIKNGTLYDTFDCRNRRMWNAWKTNQLLKYRANKWQVGQKKSS